MKGSVELKKKEKISKPAAKTQMIIKWPLLLIESVLASVNLISCNSDARGQDNVYAEPKVIFFDSLSTQNSLERFQVHWQSNVAQSPRCPV